MGESPRSGEPPIGEAAVEDVARPKRPRVGARTQAYGSVTVPTPSAVATPPPPDAESDATRDRTPRDRTPADPRDKTPHTDPPEAIERAAGNDPPPPGSRPRAVVQNPRPTEEGVNDGEDGPLPPLESAPTQAAAVLPSGNIQIPGATTDPGHDGASTDPGQTDPGAGTDPGDGEPAEPSKQKLRPVTGFGEEQEEDPFGDLKTGSTIGGRYTLEKVLGRGAMGVVFAASHSVIGKRVAVKCLYPRFRASPIVVERFFREARIAATVEHPNVIQVFDGGDVKETLFLAMELLDGETLADRLERAGEMRVREAVETFLGIMDGVAAVHALGVVHRDLKPDNIFLVRARYGRPQEPKVLDFGISKLKEPGSGRDLTSFGMVMGTPYYMAPEQVASSRDVDGRADVYSLGIMLYEALTDQVPYDGENVADIFEAAQEANAVPLHKKRAEIPRALAELVERAMQPDLENRFQSVQEMRDALAALDLHASDDDEQESFDQIRMTVRDVMSPLATGNATSLPRSAPARPQPPRERLKTEADPPDEVPNTHPGRRVPLSEEKRSTVELRRPDPGPVTPRIAPRSDRPSNEITIPQWAIAVIVAAGIVTFGAVMTAILVLLL